MELYHEFHSWHNMPCAASDGTAESFSASPHSGDMRIGTMAASRLLYHSPYEAYPFLSDGIDDLRCDFELLTDEMTSMTGLLRAQVADEDLRRELLWVGELIYHINPTLRTRMTVTEEETARLAAAVERLRNQCGAHGFVLPQGCGAACTAHLLRVKGKCLVRLLYRHMRQGHDVPNLLVDVCNLLSGYFFLLALKLNALSGVPEVPFISRNY